MPIGVRTPRAPSAAQEVSDHLRASNERLDEIEYSLDLEGTADTRHQYAYACDDLDCSKDSS
jgi:hypothetical protein